VDLRGLACNKKKIYKGANSRLVICSASDSESDKSNQRKSWSDLFRAVIGAPIDQLPALLATGVPYFFW
jgi:hypothetical protein